MAQKRVKTRYPGVYVRITTDPGRKHNGRPDKAFDFCYKDPEGKLRWETAGWLSQGVTEQYAANLRAQRLESLKTSGQSPSSAIRQEEAVGAGSPGTGERPLFSTMAEKYLKWLEGESKYVAREIYRYEAYLKSSLGGLTLDKITITEANALKHELLPRMSIGSVKKCLNLSRAIFFHASMSGLYSGLNPFSRQSGFKMPQGATECERFLTPDEAKLLLEELAKRSPQLRDMCYVSLHTGIRPCELFSLRGSDLVPQAGFFWVDGKGGKRGKVAASKAILELLSSYNRKPHEYIFQSQSGGRLERTSRTLRRAVEDLGLTPRTFIQKGNREIPIKMSQEEKKEFQRKKIWLHTFRHTFASWLAQSGTVTLLELRDLLRHESTHMTERYAHLIPDKLTEKSSKISQILVGV